MGRAADLPLLRHIAACQRTCAALGRQVSRVPGFVVALSDGEAPGLSVAIPSEDAPPAWQPALASVAAAFGRRGARPVIEYVDELHPSLASAAHGRGWHTASLAALLALTPETLVERGRDTVASDAAVSLAAAGGGSLRYLPAEDTASLEAYLRGQHRA
jgi:hypothetical protein